MPRWLKPEKSANATSAVVVAAAAATEQPEAEEEALESRLTRGQQLAAEWLDARRL